MLPTSQGLRERPHRLPFAGFGRELKSPGEGLAWSTRSKAPDRGTAFLDHPALSGIANPLIFLGAV